jgi:Arc/MetJ-type ribon-helix-helix transcriptional regulator
MSGVVDNLSGMSVEAATVCGMITGMTAKITISLPDELAEAARRAVRLGHAESVSAYIAAAMEDYRGGPTLRQLLDEWAAELGPVPEEVQRRVDVDLEVAERQAAQQSTDIGQMLRDRSA